MKAEKMVMLTGREYQEIKSKLDNDQSCIYNIGTEAKPQIINVTNIYLDTDPDFTRNPRQFAKVHDDKSVQVKIEYDDQV
ncbi:hypothetical protein [Mucilaginibacter sp. KACC 22063]|uniref:hypothetical protein n=1 Tax=Mucilaginibacter sp. KACC 22063 TaxID=3025666 RepID=UPI0023669AE6|nr:hypothetical protein [Mucilaginibacter sp. KACC 22063]WDF56623.1 hypothetical protein PQ461_06105 [Mucilaginibacter sp. KACC 22063]